MNSYIAHTQATAADSDKPQSLLRFKHKIVAGLVPNADIPTCEASQ